MAILHSLYPLILIFIIVFSLSVTSLIRLSTHFIIRKTVLGTFTNICVMVRTFLLIICVIQGFRAQEICTSPWVHHDEHCYLLHSHDRYDWIESEEYCRLYGAHLASIQDNAENIFIKGLIAQTLRSVIGVRCGTKPQTTSIRNCTFVVSPGHVWLGATDLLVEGRYVWYDTHRAVNFTDWGPAEPNSLALNIKEDCLAAWAPFGWQWADLDCHTKQFYICEMSVGDGPSIIG